MKKENNETTAALNPMKFRSVPLDQISAVLINDTGTTLSIRLKNGEQLRVFTSLRFGLSPELAANNAEANRRALATLTTLPT